MARKKTLLRYVKRNSCIGTTFYKMPFHEELFLGKSYLRDVGYRIGAVVTEMYTHAEALQKHTEVKTRLYKLEESYTNSLAPGETLLNAYHKECPTKCCTGVLEANFKSDVIGVAHWMALQGFISR